MTKRSMICITCPRGCHLEVDEETLEVRGNACEKGEQYGRSEVSNPVRVLTSTVRINGAFGTRLPVKTSKAIPKPLLFVAMREVNRVVATSPVHIGDVLVPNLLGTGADLVATKDM